MSANANRLITPKQACERVALSRATLDRMVAAGTFPKPLRITERRLAFNEADVDAWITEKLEAA